MNCYREIFSADELTDIFNRVRDNNPEYQSTYSILKTVILLVGIQLTPEIDLMFRISQTNDPKDNEIFIVRNNFQPQLPAQVIYRQTETQILEKKTDSSWRRQIIDLYNVTPDGDSIIFRAYPGYQGMEYESKSERIARRLEADRKGIEGASTFRRMTGHSVEATK